MTSMALKYSMHIVLARTMSQDVMRKTTAAMTSEAVHNASDPEEHGLFVSGSQVS